MKNTTKYTFKGTKYTIVPEIVTKSCKGCAFINTINCYKYEDRLKICRTGKIFKKEQEQ